jgi:GNAT superfamily N-acetyltransferase
LAPNEHVREAARRYDATTLPRPGRRIDRGAPRYRVERLGSRHHRAAFACGEASLDDYLRRRARHDDDRDIARVFVLAETGTDRIAGFDTLAASAVPPRDLPPDLQRTLPRYPLVPVALLGRLAIDQANVGQGLGRALLFDALARACRAGPEQVAATAVVVDALHDRYGFGRFPDDEHRLFLPMKAIARLIEDEDG